MNAQKVFQILSQMLVERRANDFIKSILGKYHKPGWTPRMLECAQEAAQRELRRREGGERAARQAERRQAAQRAGEAPSKLGRIRDMLKLARDAGKRKWPYVMLRVEGREYKLSLTSDRAAKPNQVTVNDTTNGSDRESRVWVGYILNGQIRFHRQVSDEFIRCLERLAVDPSTAAATYARETRSADAEHGQCMFCQKGLEVGESVKRSYGPICAKNYGLPFDYVAYRRKTGIAV